MKKSILLLTLLTSFTSFGHNSDAYHSAGWENLSSTKRQAKILIEKAKQGDANAQYELAKNYYEGTVVTYNLRECIYWLGKAAYQGHSEAQNELGIFYYKGIGVKRDIKQSIYWFEKAAEQGNIQARENLRKL